MNEPDIKRIQELLGEPKQQARLRALGITGTPKVELTDMDDNDNGFAIDFVFVYPNNDYPREIRFHIPLSEFPGCCGGIVIHHLEFYPEYLHWSMTNDASGRISHRGIGSFFFDLLVQVLREGAASRDNGGMLFAATTREQVAGTRMLRRRRWTRTATFRNPNTGNMVTMWCKKLTTARYDKKRSARLLRLTLF